MLPLLPPGCCEAWAMHGHFLKGDYSVDPYYWLKWFSSKSKTIQLRISDVLIYKIKFTNQRETTSPMRLWLDLMGLLMLFADTEQRLTALSPALLFGLTLTSWDSVTQGPAQWVPHLGSDQLLAIVSGSWPQSDAMAFPCGFSTRSHCAAHMALTSRTSRFVLV